LKKLLSSGKWNDTEELVNYYASKTSESKNVIDDEAVEVRVKERNQPYMESMVVISQFVESQQLRYDCFAYRIHYQKFIPICVL
jgi:hypothetical protein